MKRLCLAVLLLGVCVYSARADFLYIQYQMAFKKKAEEGQQKGQNTPGANNQQTEEKDVIILTVNSVVELSKKTSAQPNMATGKLKVTVGTKYGTTNVYNDNDLGTRVIPVTGIKARYAAKKETLAKNHTNERVYELAEWTLNYGLLDEFVALMDEVAKTGKKTGHDSLDRAVECYTQVKEALAKRTEREDSAERWRGKLGFRRSDSDHYVLLYSAALSDPPEAKRRLDLLEQNMKAVYCWFALKGQVLKLPDEKLVAVLIDDPAEFIVQRHMIEDEPLVSDGFFSARDNVVVFSAQRLDEASQLFNARMRARYAQGWDRASLLKGKATL